MGTYYQFAMIHSALYVWWTDDDGAERAMVLRTSEAEDFANWHSKQDARIQGEIARLVREHPEAVQ